jgi:ferredoxin--NADP+ reductase
MLNATVVKRIDVTPELVRFFVKPDSAVPDFLPGQYVALGLYGSAERAAHYPAEIEIPKPDKLIKRAYSVGSSPTEKEYLEFYIALVPTGALTSRLAVLKEGDRLFMAAKPVGTFTLDVVPSDKNLMLLSTGTGIAPYISMIRSESSWTPKRSITLVHGVRFAKDLAYRDEIEALSKEKPALKYIATVSRQDPGWKGNTGYIQNLISGKILEPNPANDHIFICGNPAMIEDVTSLIAKLGYSEHTKKNPGNLHLEKYW